MGWDRCGLAPIRAPTPRRSLGVVILNPIRVRARRTSSPQRSSLRHLIGLSILVDERSQSPIFHSTLRKTSKQEGSAVNEHVTDSKPHCVPRSRSRSTAQPCVARPTAGSVRLITSIHGTSILPEPSMRDCLPCVTSLEKTAPPHGVVCDVAVDTTATLPTIDGWIAQ